MQDNDEKMLQRWDWIGNYKIWSEFLVFYIITNKATKVIINVIQDSEG